MKCNRCGDEVTVDFRAQRQTCHGCNRAPSWCSCKPAENGRPRWLARLTAKELVAA